MDSAENRNHKSSSTLSTPTSARQFGASHWPAFDKPPHYYASQNSCNVKMISTQQQHQHQQPNRSSSSSQPNSNNQEQQQQDSLLASIQRKLFGILYIYAILIVSLYLTYAAYYFLQQHLQQQRLAVAINGKRSAAAAQELRGGADWVLSTGTPADTSGSLIGGGGAGAGELLPATSDSKLETKLHLLERYMELIAIDLQETKEKLREREKCDCTMSCHFNGTRYEDNSSWQNQCDICTCQMGKILCQPRKCPPIQQQCDDYVTLPGQCCPTCMRQCKYNKMLIRHGEKFNPSKTITAATTDQPRNQTKVCQCLDGRIKCELVTATTVSRKTRGSYGLVQPSATTTTKAANPSVSTPPQTKTTTTTATATTTTSTRRKNQITESSTSAEPTKKKSDTRLADQMESRATSSSK